MGERIEACDLVFSRGPRRILDRVSLTLKRGEIVALLGANGAGKSTLFRLLLGLARPHGGAVRLDNAPLDSWSRREVARRIAYVPQGHAPPFPYLVEDVVALGRIPESGLLRAPGEADRAAVRDALARLDLSRLVGRPYTEVSGGERQLVMIARALAQGARLFILDEPMTGLDFGYQTRLLGLLRSLATDGHGVLFSTHHPDHALAIADRVAVLHDGRVIADSPARSVITAPIIRCIYGVEVEIVEDASGARIVSTNTVADLQQ